MNRCEGLIKTNAANLAERAAVASSLKEISDAMANAPDIDEEKIRSIKDSLSRGAYRIEPRRIAEKLLRLDVTRRGGR